MYRLLFYKICIETNKTTELIKYVQVHLNKIIENIFQFEVKFEFELN